LPVQRNRNHLLPNFLYLHTLMPLTAALKRIKTMMKGFHDNSSTDILSTTLRLQTFGLPTFGILPHFSVWDCHTSNFFSANHYFHQFELFLAL